MDYELIKPDETHDSGSFLSYARRMASDKAERDPDMGDIVHVFHGLLGKCVPAMVADLRERLGEEPTADLMILRPKPEGGMEWWDAPEVPHDEAKAEGTWHWPCGGH